MSKLHNYTILTDELKDVNVHWEIKHIVEDSAYENYTAGTEKEYCKKLWAKGFITKQIFSKIWSTRSAECNYLAVSLKPLNLSYLVIM